jgi:hypothetical protein
MENLNIHEEKLERFKLVAMQYISNELMSQFGEPPAVDISLDNSFLFDQVVLRVVQHIWGRETERVECHWPADWWQAFKDRWFPLWAKKRWPVQYRKYALVAREMYPKVAFPQWEHRVGVYKIPE